MAHYHLDCWSGIAGDMFLGACLDLGMPLDVLADAVARLGLPGITVEARKAKRGGIAGTRFRVLENGRPIEGPDPEEVAPAPAHEHGHPEEHSHPHDHGDHSHPDHSHSDHSHENHSHGRDLAGIRRLIGESSLDLAVRDRALALFERLGRAEAKMHGIELDRVHFHEVGAVDSIVDLVGAAAAIEYLAPERLTCGPVNVGGGRVKTAHGELPVPAPATAELLSGIPIFGGGGGELTTPTGAVLLAELVDGFGELPRLTLEGAGYGLGRREVHDRPNAVRLLRGSPFQAATASDASGFPVSQGEAEVMVVECEVDNLPGEGFGFLMERLLAAGALDVYFTSVQMKKNRPGSLVTVICRRSQLEELAALLLADSGSLGCRFYAAGRFEAEREMTEVETHFGAVRIKRGHLLGKPLSSAPEFEDCRRLALAHGVPWREVYRAALVQAEAAAHDVA
jgi:uncharacterized protein (TIGR00299 family) protein